MVFVIDSHRYELPSEGVHVTVIDYTLSRLSQGIIIIIIIIIISKFGVMELLQTLLFQTLLFQVVWNNK